MFVVGENLKTLISQHEIVDSLRAFDESSLTLRLHRQVKTLDPGDSEKSIVYGDDIPESWINEKEIPDSGYLLKPRECVLGCSIERIQMPLGYLGLVQTKGSLARLFVTVQCCDAQIDPGFNGHITFEIVNLGPLRIRLRAEQEVAQLFIAKTSTKEVAAYSGRYQGANEPTTHRRRI